MDRLYQRVLLCWREFSWRQFLPLLGLSAVLFVVSCYRFLLGNGSSDTIYLWVLNACLVVVGAYYFKPAEAIRLFLCYGLGYLYLSVMHYLVLASLHLNDETFKILNWQSNGFYLEQNFIFLLPLVGLVILKDKFSYSSVQSNETTSLYRRTILCYFFAQIILTSELAQRMTELAAGSTIWQVFVTLWWKLLLCLMFCIIWIKGLESAMMNRANLSLAVLSSLTLAIVAHYLIQLPLATGELLLGQMIFSGATLFQISVLWGLFLSVYVIVNRYLLGSLLALSLGSLLVVINTIKTTLRNEPLLVTDLSWIKDTEAILSFVDSRLVLSSLSILLSIVAIYLFLRKRLFKGRLIKAYTIRMFSLVVLAIVFASGGTVFRQATQKGGQLNLPVLSSLGRDYQIAWLGFRTNANYKSLAYVWLEQLTTPVIEKPKAYNSVMMKELSTKYQTLADQINQSRTETLSDQTVIYLLSESLANPARIPGVSLSRPVMPQISQIQSQTTSGIMTSNGYGGGTANMEFQSLTGLPLYNFSPSVSIAYTEVVPKLGIVPSMSNWFDPTSRVVIHPASATNYNRNIIYRDLDFNKFIAHLNSIDKVNHLEVVGANISDKTVYRNILDEIDLSKNQFFSVMTMQNHIPWVADEPKDVIAVATGLTEEENQNLTSYARLLTATDSATSEFLTALSQLDKKITVVFYGDHLPGLYPNRLFETAPETQYQTDYFIWSNYQTTKLDYPLVNSSDFPALLLAHTNAKVSPYYALLTEVLNLSKASSEELTKEQQAVMEDLFLLQYDLTLGKRYLLENDDFFAQP